MNAEETMEEGTTSPSDRRHSFGGGRGDGCYRYRRPLNDDDDDGPEDRTKYVRLLWNGQSLNVVTSGSHSGGGEVGDRPHWPPNQAMDSDLAQDVSMAMNVLPVTTTTTTTTKSEPGHLDLSGTHSLHVTAYKPLEDRRWEKLRFNLTDESVFDWICSSGGEQQQQQQREGRTTNNEVRCDVEHVVLCLPGPRGFEAGTTNASSYRGEHRPTGRRNTGNSRRQRSASRKPRRRRDDDDGFGHGIEGFLRRKAEMFSFQNVLTEWYRRINGLLTGTRPGPFWWPSKINVKLLDHEDRLLDVVRLMPRLRIVTVILGPCSRSGYKDLDELAEEVSGVRKNTCLRIRYVDQEGREDAVVRMPNCDYEVSNKLYVKHQEFEAIRRVDGVSLRFLEWTKWLIWLGFNLLLWLIVARVLFLLALGV